MIKFKTETRICFYTSQFNRTKTFYTEVLGLEIYSQWAHGGLNGKGIIFKLGSLLVEFLESSEKGENTENYLYLEVHNIDRTWELFQGSNSNFNLLEPIKEQKWGHKNFMIEDLNGVRLKFFSIL